MCLLCCRCAPGVGRRWGGQGGADTARCTFASLTASGLGAESCRLINPLRACCEAAGQPVPSSLGISGKRFPFRREGLVFPGQQNKAVCHSPSAEGL